MTWIIISCLCVGMASYGVMSFNGTPASAEVSKETKGSFVRIEEGAKKLVLLVDGKEAAYTLSSTAWVYRNMSKATLTELQPGDELDLILNSKDQAAYIKASSPQPASGEPQSTAEEAAAPSSVVKEEPIDASQAAGADAVSGIAAEGQAASAASSPSPVPSNPDAAAQAQDPSKGKGAVNSAAKSPQATLAQQGAAALDKLDLEWKSRELMLRVKLDSAAQGKNSELYVQTREKAVVHLKGVSANAYIQMMLKGLPMERTAFEQALKQRIANEFRVQETQPEWKLDVKWQKAATPASASPSQVKGYEKEKHEDNGKDKDKGRVVHKDSDKDKDRGDDKDKEKSKDEKGKERD